MPNSNANVNVNLNFGNLPDTLQGVRTEFRTLTQQVQTLTQGTAEYNATVQRLGQLRGEIRNFRDDLNQLNPEQRIGQFQGVLNGLVGGFAAATGAAAIFGGQNEELEKTLTKVNAAIALLGGFQSMQDGIRDLQLLLGLTNPEMIILVAALAAAGAAMIYFSTQTNEAEQQLKDFQQVQSKTIDGYAKELTAIQGLKAEAQSENATRQRKKEIIQELNQISPLYFNNIKTEEDLQTKLNFAVEKYILAIQLKAKAQAADELLTEKNKQLLELQNDEIEKGSTGLAYIQQVLGTALNSTELTARGYVNAFKNSGEAAQKLQKEIDNLSKISLEAKNQLDAVGGDPTGTRNANFVQSIKNWQSYLDELEKRAEATDEKIKFQQTQFVDPNALATAAKARADALSKATGTDTIDPTKIKNPITGLNKEESLAKIENDYNAQKLVVDQQRADGIINESTHNQMLYDLDNKKNADRISILKNFHADYTKELDEQAQREIELETAKKQAKAELIQSGLALLDQAAAAAGQNTAVGKALAIASTTIQTYQAAQAAYTSQLIPGDPSSPVRAAIAAGIAIAGGLLRVKQILSVKIPSTKGGGASGGGVDTQSAPTYNAPQIAAATNTTNLSGNSLAQIQNQYNAPVRAYVVESDVTNSQQKVYGYQRQGTF